MVDPGIESNLQVLSEAARVAYSDPGGTGNVTSVSGAGPLAVFVNPWTLLSVNIQATTQGTRAVYNTILIILIMIQEFFYLGTINGLYVPFKILTHAKPHWIVMVRNLNSLLYTFVGSLCTAGAVWAFRAGWNVDGSQFALTWMALWLFAHLNFVTLDIFAIWVPIAYVPMCLITWIVFNITSILLPFELSPAFFKIGYAFPAHAVYQVLVDIWSRGCNPKLSYALPVMFAWELVGFLVSSVGIYRRAHLAALAEEAQEIAFHEQLDATVAFEKKRDREMREEEHKKFETAMARTPKPVM